MGLLLSGFYTAFHLPYFALGPEITKNYDERTVLISYRFLELFPISQISLIAFS